MQVERKSDEQGPLAETEINKEGLETVSTSTKNSGQEGGGGGGGGGGEGTDHQLLSPLSAETQRPFAYTAHIEWETVDAETKFTSAENVTQGRQR